MKLLLGKSSIILALFMYVVSDDHDDVQEPTLCEVCKFFAIELQARFHETGKSKEVIEMGHGLDTKKKRKKYNISELRLIEALQEPHICDKILEYNVHKERKGSLRFAKGTPETMQALHGLVNKGVKVDLGMPIEMWDKPSAEVTQMQRKCYDLVEKYEDDIEYWYYKHQDQNFLDYFCRNIILDATNKACLDETAELTNNKDSPKKHSASNNYQSKGDQGSKGTQKVEL